MKSDKISAMRLNYSYLSRYPKIFRAMTGLDVPEFDGLVRDILPRLVQAEHKRLSHPARQRDIGGGHPFDLSTRDQILMTVVWLRLYPTHEVLGFLFGVSDTTAGRYLQRMLPLLERAGRDTMRLPDPGRKQHRTLDALFEQLPALKAIVVDSFEQRVQRPLERDVADTYYSGKKKQHPLKSQVGVNLFTGEFVAISDSVKGPTADLTLFRQSGLAERLPTEVARLFDLGYVGVAADCPEAVCLLPCRKPRGKPRPPEDVIWNTMLASVRIRVEHSICRLRCYQALKQTDRHHRQQHTARVVSCAGLVNRQLQHRFLRVPC